MTDKTYTHLHMEAVTCLWEAMVEANQRGWMRDEENGNRDPKLEPLSGNDGDLYAAWKNAGTTEMRHAAIFLADFMLQTWDALTEDEQEALIPYDWEYAPSFLAQIGWGGQGQITIPGSPRAMADAILAKQREDKANV